VRAGNRSIQRPAVPAIPPPNEFSRRGGTCNDNRSWCNLKLELAAEYCNPEGCQQTDRVTARLTVNPGVKRSMVSFTSIYAPDDHSFIEIHFEWWVLCFNVERECGTSNTRSFDGSGSGKFYPDSTIDLYDSRITHGFTLWAYFTRNGSW
jgi:hypothetical protein